MNNTVKKFISLLLACLMLTGVTGSALAADESNEVKRISCTMYANGATGRGFCWYTVSKSAADLQIIPTADFNGSFENAKNYSGTVEVYRSQYSHRVAVTDLAPGTQYTYRVGDAAADIWSEPCSFVTDDGDGAFSFIAIADVQASSDENFKTASNTLRAAVETLPDSEFYINLGDYVNDNTNEEWDWYFSNFAFADTKTTHVPVAGNHDGNITNKLNTFCFKNTFCLDESDNQSVEGVYYSFDYGNAHFAVLNTNDMYPMSQAQRNWLVNDMSNSDAIWKIVLMHRSLYSAGKNINKPDTIVMRNVLLPLIDELDIDMVMSGHDHMYLRTTQVYADRAVENVEYVTETYNGVETVFAVDPEGTVFAMPSTAGTKRYAVNEDAIPPILDVADKAFSTRELGGCFCTTQIDGNKLIYNAYTVNDDTQEITKVDSYAIIKNNASSDSDGKDLPDGIMITVLTQLANFVAELCKMLGSYIKLLFS